MRRGERQEDDTGRAILVTDYAELEKRLRAQESRLNDLALDFRDIGGRNADAKAEECEVVADCLRQARVAISSITRKLEGALAALDLADAAMVRRIAFAFNPMPFNNHAALYQYCRDKGDSEETAQQYADDTHQPDIDNLMAQTRRALIALRGYVLSRENAP